MNMLPIAAATLSACLFASPVLAADKATAEEAVAMVKKAVDFIKANGTENAYAEIDNKQGQFVSRDLYVVVYGLDGKCLAHGANPKLIGKDLSDAQDVDGTFYVKDRVTLARTQQSFWQTYKFTNPETRKVEPKKMYCERLNETAVCGGIYL